MSKLSFGDWALDLTNEIFLKGDKRVPLTKRAFQVLVTLVKAKGELVTKDQLLDEVWRGVIVEENNLQAQISTLRRKLGSDRRLISTEFGIGYRFLGEIKASEISDTNQEISVIRPNKIVSREQKLPPILGRERELTQLTGLLSENQLVTITGTAGMGKTRLAKELAFAHTTHFEEGAKFVELAAIQENRHVSAAILSQLDVHSSFDLLSPEDISRLSSTNIFLVIDNCEHIIDAVAESISKLLLHAPNLTILTTSQEPLNIDGEHQFQLTPLQLPEKLPDSGNEPDSPAVQLFCRHASAIQFGFSPTTEQLATITSICRQLDGLPLAIELAAARITLFSLNDIERSLSERLIYLTSGKRSSDPRHKTLMGAIDWSFRLLTEFEKQLFQCLSVFANKFTLTNVIQLYQSLEKNAEIEEWEIAEGINNLLSKSLLQKSISAEDISSFYFLESLKIFANHKLKESDKHNKLKRAHAQIFRQQTEQANYDWIEMPSDRWNLKYQAQINDLCLALDWAVIEKNDLTLGIQILKNTPAFWITFSMYDECRRYIEPILNTYTYVDYQHLTISAQEIMHLNCALGKALTWSKGPIQETQLSWERTLEIGHELEDREAQLQAHYGLWLYCLRTNQFRKALGHAKSFSAIAERVSPDYDAIATGIRIEGVAKHYLGQHRCAIEKLERSIKLMETYPSNQPYRFGLDQLVAAKAFASRVYWILGKTHIAMDVARSSLERAYELNHVCSICCSLAEGICMVAFLNNNIEQVSELATELKQLSSNSNLNLWNTYSELYITWVESNTLNSDSLRSAFAGKISSLTQKKLHWLYSTLLFEAIVKAGMDELLKALRIEDILGTEHWAKPIYIFHVSDLAPDEAQKKSLIEQSMSVAREEGAYSWLLRLQVHLAEKSLVETGTIEHSTLSEALTMVEINTHVADVRRAQKLLAL